MSIILQVMIIGPPDTLFEGGFFKCHLFFPTEYPLKPPVLRWVWSYRVDVGINDDDVFPDSWQTSTIPTLRRTARSASQSCMIPGTTGEHMLHIFQEWQECECAKFLFYCEVPNPVPPDWSLLIILLLQNILPALPESVRDSLIDDTLLDMGMRKRQRDGCLFTQWRLSSYQSYLC